MYFLRLSKAPLISGNMVCCGDPPCPSNINTCYNCEVVGGCNLTEIFNTTEEECLNNLTQQVSLWSVEYNFISGTCRGSNCEDIQIKHNAEKVIHQKTCNTGDSILLELCWLIKKNFKIIISIWLFFSNSNFCKMNIFVWKYMEM